MVSRYHECRHPLAVPTTQSVHSDLMPDVTGIHTTYRDLPHTLGIQGVFVRGTWGQVASCRLLAVRIDTSDTFRELVRGQARSF